MSNEIGFGTLPGQNFFCRLHIKDREYVTANIDSLVIREWVFDTLPKIELEIYDDGFLSEIFPLEDRDVISIYLGRHDDDNNAIDLDFVMDNYVIEVVGDNKKVKVSISGYLKADDIFTLRNRSFNRSNSSNILQQIASESNIEFSNPRTVVPSDNMTWYQLQQSNYDFIKHILKRSYTPNDVAFFYANTKNKFVYTSLNEEIRKRVVKVAKYSIENFDKNVVDNNTMWFNVYDIVNMGGTINNKYGYGASCSYYNQEDVVNEELVDRDLGNPKLTQLSFKNRALNNKPVFNKAFGIFDNNLYSEDFFKAAVTNEYLKADFFKQSVVINVNSLSDVSLFDKVDLLLPSMLSNQEIDMNETFSGKYLVGGIVHQISSNGIYNKFISLHRSGIEASPYMDSTKHQYNVEEN